MKWEYLTFDYEISNEEQGSLSEELNKLGTNGWELVFINDKRKTIYPHYELILKRPKHE